jgi:hypothetical protein
LTISQLTGWNADCISKRTDIIIVEMQLDLGFGKFGVSSNNVCFCCASKVFDETIVKDHSIAIMIFQVFGHGREHIISPGAEQ